MSSVESIRHAPPATVDALTSTSKTARPTHWSGIVDSWGFGVAGLVLLAKAVAVAIVDRPAAGDEAVTGLMAWHLLTGREAPIFFYGQTYLGSLEAIIAAGFFAILGVSTGVLRLAPLFFEGVWVAVTFVLARAWIGSGWAGLAALFAAVPPSIAAYLSLTPVGGSGSATIALAWLAVWAGWRIRSRSGSQLHSFDWLLFGMVSGLALWNHLLALPGVLVGLWLAGPLRATPSKHALALAGFLVGFAPWIVWNVLHDWASIAVLHSMSTTQTPGENGWLVRLEHVRILFRYALPGALGLTNPYSLEPQRIGLLLLPFWLIGAVAWLQRLTRPDDGSSRQWAGRLLPSAAVAVLAILLFVGGGWDPIGQQMTVRYLVVLAGAVPLWMAWVTADVARRSHRASALLLGLALAVLGLQNTQIVLAGPLGTLDDARALSDQLIDADLTRVYASYWVAFPLTWESRERVIASTHFHLADRYNPYQQVLAAEPRPSFLVCAGSEAEQNVRTALQERRLESSRIELSGGRVAYRVGQPLPADFDVQLPFELACPS